MLNQRKPTNIHQKDKAKHKKLNILSFHKTIWQIVVIDNVMEKIYGGK